MAHQYKIKSNEASKGYETPDDEEEDKEQKSMCTCRSLLPRVILHNLHTWTAKNVKFRDLDDEDKDEKDS